VESLGALAVFLQAADHGSFAGASRSLGISPSAVGKAISRLEARVGVRLFHRSTRKITLTTEGELFRERCRRITCELEAAESELSLSRGKPEGKLRISLPMIGMLLMPPMLEFMRKYPDIELELDFTDRMVDVIGEGFDAVIRTGYLQDSGLMTRQLGRFRHVLLASPAYLREHGEPKHPHDLLQHACLRHRYPDTGKLEPWPLSPEHAGDMEVPVSATANVLEPLLYMVEDGRGIACMPDFTVKEQLADGRLIKLMDDYVFRCGTIHLLWPSSRYLSPRLRVFIDFLSEKLFPET